MLARDCFHSSYSLKIFEVVVDSLYMTSCLIIRCCDSFQNGYEFGIGLAVGLLILLGALTVLINLRHFFDIFAVRYLNFTGDS